MLRTLFTIGLVAFIGLLALKVVFGLLGPLVGLLFILIKFAAVVALVGGAAYVALRVISPSTAERLTSGFRK